MPYFSRAVLSTALAGTLAAAPPAPAKLDLAQGRTLFVVNYAHLDTQWRWTYPIVVRDMLRNTLYDNFARMEAHPDYVFSWTGADRYEMFKEYYPQEYLRLKAYVAKGQWWPAGNAWEEGDVNVPSSESVLRQLLVGHTFFQREFGTESFDFMLPDCFGFPASLPSILAHCGIKGFSTQKLTWGSAVGIPFNLGRWEGPDGRSVVAALNGGDYAAHLTTPLDGLDWVRRLDGNGAAGGPRADYLYNGTGDEGGAPHEDSMTTLDAALAAKGPVRVVAGRSDALFTSFTEAQKAALPVYRGDLLLTEHSAGSINSQAFMKQLNRQDELLADAAEKAAAAALVLGAGSYPAATLEKGWKLVLRNQFHDLLPGTSQPKAYEYGWNDGFIAAKAFQGSLEDAVAAVARGLDTRTGGVPLVIFNPLGIARRDPVEARVPAGLTGVDLVAVDAQGRPQPTQLVTGLDGQPRVLFLAEVPAVGFAVYGLRAGSAPGATGLAAGARTLENAAYQVTLLESGDIGSILDKANGREMLSGPLRLAFQQEKPAQFPAWNMDWNDRKEPPRAFLSGPVRISVAESGPVRAALLVERESLGSRFRQSIRLTLGGDRVEVATTVDWKSSESSLKATFPLAVSNPEATYAWDLGTVRRGNNDPRKFEVPTHGWMDLTDRDGAYGVTVLTGAKYGSDKPDDRTLRLTLLYSPGVRDDYKEMQYQDWGRHSFRYALAGHRGDWSATGGPWLALRQDQPLTAYAVSSHRGVLGRTYSFLNTSSAQVAIQAIKRAEDGSCVVVRLQELTGHPAKGVRLATAGSFRAARELDGLERPLGDLAVAQGGLDLDFGPYQLRTLGLDLTPAQAVPPPSGALPLDLPFNLQAFSTNEHREEGAMDGAFTGYPAEQLEASLEVAGVTLRLGPREDRRLDAVACRGQVVALPRGTRSLHLLVAANGRPVGRALATEGPGSGGPAGGQSVSARFRVGTVPVTVEVPSWRGYLGSWDNRVFDGVVPEYTFNVAFPLDHLDPAWLTPARPAWWASHHHAKGRDQIYDYSYMFAVRLEVPEGAASFSLPDDPRVKVFAATAARVDNGGARSLCPLFPDLDRDAWFRNRFEY